MFSLLWHIYIYIHTHVYVCVCMYMYTYMYVYIYIYIYTHVYDVIHICTYSHIYIHIYVYIHTYIHIFMYMCICIHTCTHIMCMYVYMYICITRQEFHAYACLFPLHYYFQLLCVKLVTVSLQEVNVNSIIIAMHISSLCKSPEHVHWIVEATVNWKDSEIVQHMFWCCGTCTQVNYNTIIIFVICVFCLCHGYMLTILHVCTHIWDIHLSLSL